MIFIWGKRSYGSVRRVGNVSVKTVFGHLWYLPLFPMKSYYCDSAKDGAAFELNGIHWGSVLSAYIRVWLTLAVVVMGFSYKVERERGGGALNLAVVIIGTLLVLGSYLADRKLIKTPTAALRLLMQRHFGLALDPHECLSNLSMEIDRKMQARHEATQSPSWYKLVLADAFAPRDALELAVLRARCDQQDATLQLSALQRLERVSLAK